METKIEKMKEIISRHYRELEKLPKPERSFIGGTYYGSTEIRQTVGNHLEVEENARHVSYGYGCNTYYKDAYFMRVGGAYNYSGKKLVTELIEAFGGRYDSDSRIGIIEDRGTNYSVFGFGTICR